MIISQLEDLTRALRKLGVKSFQNGDFSVEFHARHKRKAKEAPAPFIPISDDDLTDEEKSAKEHRDMYWSVGRA